MNKTTARPLYPSFNDMATAVLSAKVPPPDPAERVQIVGCNKHGEAILAEAELSLPRDLSPFDSEIVIMEARL